MVVLLMQSGEFLRHQYAADELFFHTILWTFQTYSTLKDVSKVYKSCFYPFLILTLYANVGIKLALVYSDA